MRNCSEIFDYLCELAPLELQADFDNSGFLIGRSSAEVSHVLLALDITEEVITEAIEKKASLIVSHHPLIFHKLRSVTDTDSDDRVLRLAENRIAAICMHTNLDAAEGGVNDMLAHRLGLTDLIPLSVEKIGRVGTLNSEIPLVEFTRSVVKLLRANGLRYTDRGRPVQRVAVGGGACGDYIRQAVEKGCDTFVTSDLKYYDFLDTTEINLIDAGHFPTEDLICTELVRRISAAFPGVTSVKTAAHCREIIQYCIKES